MKAVARSSNNRIGSTSIQAFLDRSVLVDGNRFSVVADAARKDSLLSWLVRVSARV